MTGRLWCVREPQISLWITKWGFMIHKRVCGDSVIHKAGPA